MTGREQHQFLPPPTSSVQYILGPQASNRDASGRGSNSNINKLPGAKRHFYVNVLLIGAIEDKYDVAISTACGPLDNIVVDTLKTGQQCVDYLKRTNLGVCTFILLEKMQQWAEKADKAIKTYVCIP